MNFNKLKKAFESAYNAKIDIVAFIKNHPEYSEAFRDFNNALGTTHGLSDVQITFGKDDIYVSLSQNELSHEIHLVISKELIK